LSIYNGMRVPTDSVVSSRGQGQHQWLSAKPADVPRRYWKRSSSAVILL